MSAAEQESSEPVTVQGPGQRIALVRLATGLVQGFLLYLLYYAAQGKAEWPATQPLLFAPLLLVCLFVPVLLHTGVGSLNRRQLLIWVAVAAAIIVALGVHDIWRDLGQVRIGTAILGTDARARVQTPSPPLLLFLAAGFFIAQSLVLAAARERRRIASYAAYFETAWKLFVQLSFSAVFVGVAWGVLWLGANLFLLVKLDFFERLVQEPAFSIPVIAFAFACAMHVTDVRPALVRGIRTLLLVLMSWILPVATLIVGGFLLSLPFTGLEPLWATRRAAIVLLCAAALLVILINAAFQDGAPDMAVARVIRSSASLASLLLVPITALAIYALALRVGEYGWTTERVIGAACLVVATCYAVGYAWATLRPGWLDRIAHVNVATAFVVLALALMVFSPIADPARLSVSSQLARLAAGRVSPAQFDFGWLRFYGARYGRAALAALYAGSTGPQATVIRDKVASAAELTQPWQRPGLEGATTTPGEINPELTIWPKGARLPASFLQTNWNLDTPVRSTPGCLHPQGGKCDVFMVDLTGDGKTEIIVMGAGDERKTSVIGQHDSGRWMVMGSLSPRFARCEPMRKAMQGGLFRSIPARLTDLEVAGTRVRIDPHRYADEFKCPGESK